jgi:predicted O-methyltransferase YrrM
MTVFNDAALDGYVRGLMAEDDVLRRARERSAQEDMPPVPPEVGAFLWLAAKWSAATSAVEVGTGAGLSGIWIVRGMGPAGRLVTIDVDAEHQRLAREAYREAGIDGQVRTLLGRAADVLPGLPARSADLVFLDTAKSESGTYLDEALRLVRPGGVIIADDVLWHGRVADPRSRAVETDGARLHNDRIFADPRLSSVILPFGNGVSVSLMSGRSDS